MKLVVVVVVVCRELEDKALAAHKHHSCSPQLASLSSPQASPPGRSPSSAAALPLPTIISQEGPSPAAAELHSSRAALETKSADSDMEDVSLADNPTVSRFTGYGRMP